MRCNHFIFLLLMVIPSLNGCFTRKYVVELGVVHTAKIDEKDAEIKKLETQLAQAEETIRAYSDIVDQFEKELSAKYASTTTRTTAVDTFEKCQKEQMAEGRSCMLRAEMKPVKGCDTKDPMPNTYKQSKLSEEEAALRKKDLVDSNFAAYAPKGMPNCKYFFEYTTDVQIQEP